LTEDGIPEFRITTAWDAAGSVFVSGYPVIKQRILTQETTTCIAFSDFSMQSGIKEGKKDQDDNPAIPKNNAANRITMINSTIRMAYTMSNATI
jgi:hypothetical protein